MDAELKQISEKMESAFGEFKKALDAKNEEVKKLGEASALAQEKLDKTNAALDVLEKAQQKRLDELEAMIKSPPDPEPTEDKKAELEAKKKEEAFDKFLRQGKDVLDAEERKLMTIADDTTGGYLATDDFRNEIIKGIIDFSPVRSVARVIPTSKRSVKIPVRTGVFAAQWVAETATRTETTGLTYGLEEIPNHELYAMVDVSVQNLEDSDFNLEAEIKAEAAEQFGVAEGTAFISGDGVGKPQGVLNGTGLASVDTGASNDVTADKLIEQYYSVRESYAARGTWFMRREIIQTIRQLAEGTTSAYIWQRGFENTPATLMGRPYREAIDLDLAADAANMVLFGDFARGYAICDRVQISIVRDDLTQAASGVVRFWVRKRVGGQVVLGEALSVMVG